MEHQYIINEFAKCRSCLYFDTYIEGCDMWYDDPSDCDDYEPYFVSPLTVEYIIYRKILESSGRDAQIDILTEECGELLSAINKYRRGRVGKRDVLDEITDVMIILDQMRVMLSQDDNYDGESEQYIAQRRNKIYYRLRDLIGGGIYWEGEDKHNEKP